MSQDSDQKVRRTSSEMYPMVEQWVSSGLSQKDFCHLHALSVGTFHYWVQKYRADSPPSNPCFVALVAPAPAEPAAWGEDLARLAYGDIRLEFGSGVSASFLAQVVQELSQRC